MFQNAKPGILRLVERRQQSPRPSRSSAMQPSSLLAAALVHQRIEHHDDHAEERKHDFRQNANVFDALRAASESLPA